MEDELPRRDVLPLYFRCMETIRVLDVQGRIAYSAQDGGTRGMWVVTEMLQEHPAIEYAVLAMNTRRHWVDPSEILQGYRHLRHWWAAVDNRIHILGALWNLLNGEPYHISRFRSQPFAEQFRNVLREFRPHLVLLEGLPLTQYVPLIRDLTKAAVVYHAHNVEHVIWKRLAEAENNVLRRYYLREQARRLARYETTLFRSDVLDGIVTFSSTDAATIRAIGYRGSIHVKPFALAVDRIEPSYAPEEVPTLFHIGSLEWEPNRQAVEWFLRQVFPQIRRTVPTAEFHLAGYIPRNAVIPSQEGVYWHGKVPEAFEFMRSRSILVVPLRAGSGVRVKIIEAMALGKAIVSTSIGAEGIECNPGSHLLIADSATGFAEAVIGLLQDRSTIETLGRNARRFVEEYHDLERESNKLANFLIEIAAHRR